MAAMINTRPIMLSGNAFSTGVPVNIKTEFKIMSIKPVYMSEKWVIILVLGFIIVRKGLVFANEHNNLGFCKSGGEDSAHRMVGCGP